MSRSRIRKLERDVRLHEPPPCRVCRGILPIEYLDEFVTDATPAAEVYFRRALDDGPPTPPCPGCGCLPHTIEVCAYEPVVRPRGAPRPGNGKAQTMTKEEADLWHAAAAAAAGAK